MLAKNITLVYWLRIIPIKLKIFFYKGQTEIALYGRYRGKYIYREGSKKWWGAHVSCNVMRYPPNQIRLYGPVFVWALLQFVLQLPYCLLIISTHTVSTLSYQYVYNHYII